MRGAADATKCSGIKQALAHARVHCAPTYRDVGVMPWAFTAPYGAPRVLPDLWGTSGDDHLARPNRRARYCDFPSLIAPVVPLDANVGDLQVLGVLRMPLMQLLLYCFGQDPCCVGKAPPPPSPQGPPPPGACTCSCTIHTPNKAEQKKMPRRGGAGWLGKGGATQGNRTQGMFK